MTTARSIRSVPPEPVVEFDKNIGAVVISHLVITDPAVVGEARHWTTGRRGPAVTDNDLTDVDLAPFVQCALSTGAIAIRNAGGTQEAHHLDRLVTEVGDRSAAAAKAASDSTNSVVAQATQAMTRTTETAQKAIAEAGQTAQKAFTTHVDQARDSLIKELLTLLGGDNPQIRAQLDAAMTRFAHNLDKTVNTRTEELFGRAAKQLDPRDPTSPLAEFTKHIGQQQAQGISEIVKENKRLTEQIEKLTIAVHASSASKAATDAATKVTPLKGGTYESVMHEVMDEFAASIGDSYTDTSRVVGNSNRCFKGDGVLEVGGGEHPIRARVVVEMTDSAKVRDWATYLKDSEINRGADASLGLVPSIEQVPGGHLVRTFGPRRMVMAFDPEAGDTELLRAVLLVLRCQAQVAASRSNNEHVETAEEKLAESLECIESLAGIQKTAGSIRKGADKIDAECAAMYTTLRRLLAEAQAALGGCGESETAA